VNVSVRINQSSYFSGDGDSRYYMDGCLYHGLVEVNYNGILTELSIANNNSGNTVQHVLLLLLLCNGHGKQPASIILTSSDKQPVTFRSGRTRLWLSA